MHIPTLDEIRMWGKDRCWKNPCQKMGNRDYCGEVAARTPNCVGMDKTVIFDLALNRTIISWGPMNITSTLDYVMTWHLTGCIFNEELGHPFGAKPLPKPMLNYQ